MRAALSLLVPVSDWERKLGEKTGTKQGREGSWVREKTGWGGELGESQLLVVQGSRVGAGAAPSDPSPPQGCRPPVPSLPPCLARMAACCGRALLQRTCSGCSVASSSWAWQRARAASWWRSHCPSQQSTCGQVSASRALDALSALAFLTWWPPGGMAA